MKLSAWQLVGSVVFIASPVAAGDPTEAAAKDVESVVRNTKEIRLGSEAPVKRAEWQTRDRLLGDIAGIRPFLGRFGLSLDIESVDEGFSNPARNNRSLEEGGRYAGLTDVVVSLDTQTAGWWRGGTIVVGAQNVRGGDISEIVGDLQGISNIIAPPGTRFVEYHLVQELARGKALLKIGKQDANADFVVSDGGSEFVNSSFGIIPTVPLPTFPAPALGVMAEWTSTRSMRFKAGLWDGAPAVGSGCVKTTFDGSGGIVGAAEIEVRPFPNASLSGSVRLGAWHHSEVELAVETEEPAAQGVGPASGFYFTADQSLWQRGTRTLAVFAQVGWGEADRSAVTGYLGGGLTFRGPFKGRPRDVAGIGFAHAEIGDLDRSLPDLRSETVVELFYRVPMTNWLTITPDLQWVIRPNGENREAFVAGLRVSTIF
jgi:porin